MPVLTVNAVDLYYEVHGEGAPVLGIHGSPCSALIWEDAAGRLGRRYRCIVYDRRGYFGSERPDPGGFNSSSQHRRGFSMTVSR